MRTTHSQTDPCGCSASIPLGGQWVLDIDPPNGGNILALYPDLFRIMEQQSTGVWEIDDQSNPRK